MNLEQIAIFVKHVFWHPYDVISDQKKVESLYPKPIYNPIYKPVFPEHLDDVIDDVTFREGKKPRDFYPGLTLTMLINSDR